MLRIDITTDRSLTNLRLIGDLRVDELEELERHLSGASGEVTLDLEELKIVDLAAVRFLLLCEDRGVRMLGCPYYVREWMNRERERRKPG
jgi:ABC-type transporter Mla MlaB component